MSPYADGVVPMTDNLPLANPQFASASSSTPTSPTLSRRAVQSTAKLGGYGGMAVAAWLVTAVATGYGLAGADTTGTSSESSSTSSTTSSGESSSGSAGTSTTGTATSSTPTSTSGGSTSTGSTTSPSIGDAPDVTISSSGGAHTSTTEAEASTAPTPADSELPEDPSDVDTQPESSEPASGETGESSQPSTPPASQEPEPEPATSAPAETGSDSAPSATANMTTPATSTGAEKVVVTVAHPSATDTESNEMPTAQALQDNTSSGVLTTQTVAAVTAPATPTVGIVGFLNGIVTNLLNPFLAPAPNTPEPFTPVVWAVLGWVRRQLFNQAPTITYNPTTSVQTGQTVTGNIGATDPEGDALSYKVTKAPQYGTLTIDQATGNFTYTPHDINYDAAQLDSFTVSVTDGKFNLLSLFTPHSDQETIEVTTLNPTVERVILNMPPGITKPVNPRYSEDGKSIYFSGTPAAGGRGEIYQINIDGTDAKCLTCGLVAPAVAGTDPASPINILKPVPFYDGTGRVVVLLNNPDPRYAIFEPAGYNGIGSPARIVNVITPDGGGANLPGLPFPGGIINREREMRPSPDGTHVLFTRIVIGQTGNFQALPIVGELTLNGDHYDVTNARVVWPTGESKQWTPDGKGVIIQGGAIDAGGVDDIMVDLSGQTGDILFPGSPFRGTRVTGNLDYDEDIDMSPNMAWITVGSTRGFEALTPITRIVRQNFLPVYVAAPIYDQYADGQVRNVSNQNWAVAIEDDLNRENGIPLFVQDDPTTPGVDEGDGWISRSMPSWNADGTAVTFWESGNGDEHGIAPTESRIVIANLKYTTSVGPVGDTTTVFNPSAFPDLQTYVAKTTPLPPTGTYSGVGGGTAVVSEVFNPTTFQTTRTVVYTGYVNEDGLILNGTESAIYGPSQLSVTYLADIDVTDDTGDNRGSLDANAVVTLLPTQSVTGFITSTLDGDTQTIPDPAKVEDAKTGA